MAAPQKTVIYSAPISATVDAGNAGAHTTVTIANGTTADVWIDSRGVTRLTADV